MPDILHRVGMQGSPAQVYDAIATTKGLSHWWITGTTGETSVGGVVKIRPEKGRGEDGFDMRVIESKPGEVGLVVLAITVGLSRRRRQHAFLLIPANGGRSDTRSLREFGDLHAASVDLRATRRSRPDLRANPVAQGLRSSTSPVTR